ncbi:MAG: hypothetical protein ACRD9Q_04925 [Nitrososphaeraceae archaeon]
MNELIPISKETNYLEVKECPKTKFKIDYYHNGQILFCQTNGKYFPQSTEWSDTQHG